MAIRELYPDLPARITLREEQGELILGNGFPVSPIAKVFMWILALGWNGFLWYVILAPDVEWEGGSAPKVPLGLFAVIGLFLFWAALSQQFLVREWCFGPNLVEERTGWRFLSKRGKRTYRNGRFVLLDCVDSERGSEVELRVEASNTLPAMIHSTLWCGEEQLVKLANLISSRTGWRISREADGK